MLSANKVVAQLRLSFVGLSDRLLQGRRDVDLAGIDTARGFRQRFQLAIHRQLDCRRRNLHAF